MTGAVWAAASGLGFGVFQSLNRRAVAQMDVYFATFLQLLVACAVLLALTASTEDLDALRSATARGIGFFVAAGLVHFFAGWTFLNVSQKRIGAARTSPLIATTPLFGAFIALVTLGEIPGMLAWLGIVLVTVGAYVVGVARLSGAPAGLRWSETSYGLACAFAWSLSPVLVREGLKGLDSPLIGLSIGMVAAVAAFALALVVRGRGVASEPLVWDALTFKLVAGVFVGLSTWGRWVALDLTTIGVVLALNLLSVPVVLTLSPLLMGRHVEHVTPKVWLGAFLVIGGSLLLIARSL